MILRLVVYGLTAAVLGFAVATTLVSRELEPVAAEAPEVLFEVKRGDTLRAIASRLEREGLVRDARVTSWWARWRGQAGSLKAGQYRLAASMTPGAILDRIASGKVATWSVSIPEGLTGVEIARRIAEAGLVDEAEFVAAFRDPELARALGIEAPTLEGYLFPETYQLPRGKSGVDVVRVLVGQFERAWAQVAEAAAARGLTRHEVVTLASVVEKETGAAEERPLIASVFHNRLKRGMRLESDPTIIYGIPDFDGNLRRRDLDNAANRYNTYQHAGLPPGPIANPGLDSLRAVVEPAESEFLFFVSRNDGTHFFSRTYREHAKAVDRFQRRRSSR